MAKILPFLWKSTVFNLFDIKFDFKIDWASILRQMRNKTWRELAHISSEQQMLPPRESAFANDFFQTNEILAILNVPIIYCNQ